MNSIQLPEGEAWRKPREGAIIATHGERIARIQIDCRDIDVAVGIGEDILACAPVGDAANVALAAINSNGRVDLLGCVLAALVARKLGEIGLHELRAGREVRFIFGPEDGRLRAFTAKPNAVH